MSGEHTFLLSSERDVYSELLAASRQDVKTVGSDALGNVTGYATHTINRFIRRRSSDNDGRQQSLSLFALADLIVFSDGEALHVLRILNELAELVAVPKSGGKEMPHGAGAVACVSGDFAALLHGMSEALKDDNRISAEEIIEHGLIERAGDLERAGAELKGRFKGRVAAKLNGRADDD